MAVWRPHHRDVRPDSLEPIDAIHPAALNRCLAFQLESQLDEESRRGHEVVNHDAHVVHALDRHALDSSEPAGDLDAVACRVATALFCGRRCSRASGDAVSARRGGMLADMSTT